MVDAIRTFYKKTSHPRTSQLALLTLITLFFCGGCGGPGTKESGDVLKQALAGQDPAIKKVMQQPEHFELQIQLILPKDITLLNTGQNQNMTPAVHEVDYSQGQYFYPASTVKLPVAVLAAEWAELHPEINIITPYRIENDSTSHYIAQDIVKIFSVSDNQALNRLYDLLGRDYINRRMAELAVGPFRLAHRLSVENAAAAQHPVFLFETDQGLQRLQAEPDQPIDSIDILGTLKGVGYKQDEQMVRRPMDFSRKNYFPLQTMMKFMQVLFPTECAGCPSKLKWLKNTEDFVKSMMSTVPRKQGYDESEYPDGYVKFFFLGDTKQRIDPSLKIHNKVGYAYGTLTDIAYVVDTKHKLNYLLGATLLVNENGIFNDNTYEYETVGLPFLAQVSRGLHQLLIEAKSGG